MGLAEQLGQFRIGLAYGMDFRLSNESFATYEIWNESLAEDHPFISSRYSAGDFPRLASSFDEELLDSGDLPPDATIELLPRGRWSYWSWQIEIGRNRAMWNIGGDHFFPISNPAYLRLGSRWHLGYTFYF